MSFFHILAIWILVDGELYETYEFYRSNEACSEAIWEWTDKIKSIGGEVDMMACRSTGILSKSLRPKARPKFEADKKVT